jgi:hypothetical protein
METTQKDELSSFLSVLPPVDFCCVYGSTLHPNNQDKSKMVDYILGVSDPIKWHSANLKMNSDHYASWMVHLGGARLVYIYSLYTIFLHCLYGLNQILNSQFLFNLRIDYKCCR